MLLQPTPINSVAHPLIASAYLKKGFGSSADLGSEDILVIETRTDDNSDQWLDFLSDLDLIIDQIDRKGCKFDSVEIRRH